jgi:transcriptional regulator with XRE-family HTH domain
MRERMGLTQQEFATLLGVSTVSISRWEHQHTKPTDSSHALVALLDRAIARKGDRGLTKIMDTLRNISGTNELARIIALVHLGD